MNRMTVAVQIAKQSKREARRLLDIENNRLWLILSLCLWLFTAGAIYMLGAGLIYAADASIFTEQPSAFASIMVLLSYGLMLLLALGFLVPMSGGIVLLARRVYERQMLCAPDLFIPFDSFGQYFRCFGLGLYVWIRWGLVIVAAVIGCLFLPSLLYEAMLETGAINVLCVLACLVCAVLGGLLTIAVYCLCMASGITLVLMARDEGWGLARAHAILYCLGHFPTLWYYHVSLLGHAALAALTVGVSAILDTLPMMLLSHQYLCDALIQHKKQN